MVKSEWLKGVPDAAVYKALKTKLEVTWMLIKMWNKNKNVTAATGN